MSLQGWVQGVTDRAALTTILMEVNGELSGAETMYEEEAKKYADAIVKAGYRREEA